MRLSFRTSGSGVIPFAAGAPLPRAAPKSRLAHHIHGRHMWPSSHLRFGRHRFYSSHHGLRRHALLGWRTTTSGGTAHSARTSNLGDTWVLAGARLLWATHSLDWRTLFSGDTNLPAGAHSMRATPLKRLRTNTTGDT